jgi:hypothetical protein
MQEAAASRDVSPVYPPKDVVRESWVHSGDSLVETSVSEILAGPIDYRRPVPLPTVRYNDNEPLSAPSYAIRFSIYGNRSALRGYPFVGHRVLEGRLS